MKYKYSIIAAVCSLVFLAYSVITELSQIGTLRITGLIAVGGVLVVLRFVNAERYYLRNKKKGVA